MCDFVFSWPIFVFPRKKRSSNIRLCRRLSAESDSLKIDETQFLICIEFACVASISVSAFFTV